LVQDMSTGVRKPLLEFPQFEKPLARLLAEREALKAHAAALRAGRVALAKTMGRRFFLLVGLGTVVVVVVASWLFLRTPPPKPLLYREVVASLGKPIDKPDLPDVEDEVERILAEERKANRRRRARGAVLSREPGGVKTYGDDSEFAVATLDMTSAPASHKSHGVGRNAAFSQEDVDRVVGSKFGLLQACLTRELKKNRSLGDVRISFWVRPTGATGGVKVHGNGSRSLAECLQRVIAGLKFPPFDGTPVKVSYPIKISR